VSVYAVVANLIWAVWGFHSDAVMVQIAALWPLAMLLVLLLLGRGRSRSTTLLLALVAVPMVALFAVGSFKRDLFELRYFAAAVPPIVLLGARLVAVTVRRQASFVAWGAVAALTMSVGLVDQQLNGANPRLYDFEGALETVRDQAGPGDVVIYEPVYLSEVVEYYAPNVETRPISNWVPPEGVTVWVVTTERVVNTEESAARVGAQLARLEQDRVVVDRFERPNVRVWVLR
jgi:hypothetical protein